MRGNDEATGWCLTYNMKVMLENNILINVNKLKYYFNMWNYILGDKIMNQ